MHAGSSVQPGAARLSRLPGQLTSFVGRERAIIEVDRTLTTRRLLTLTGTGGVGKTRLALEVGAIQAASYPEGIWQVELGYLADSDLVADTVAATLGLGRVAGESVLDSLIARLEARPALLILDNCEHVVQACAQLADWLLRACPNLRILATSRRPLGVAGETA